MRNKLLKKIRTLSQLLMISGACNILMLALVIYWYVKECPPTPLCEKKPAVTQNTPISQATASNERAIQSFQGRTFQDLFKELNRSEMLENGFTHRDLALGYLITEHHFDIKRAFIDIPKPSQRRRIIYKDKSGKQKELKTFADLREGHFLAAIAFGSKEKWPLTAKGLFLLLQEEGNSTNKSLKYAFFLTPEFTSVEHLFKRSNEEVRRDTLLQMICEGPWEILAQFADYQRVSQNLSDMQRRQLLINYVMAGSPTAASLLLKTDAEYALKNLNDDEAIAILTLSKEKTRDAAKYALTMLASPRSDSVWKVAAARLYEYTGEPAPQDVSKYSAIKKFLPGLAEKAVTPPQKQIQPVKQQVIAKPQAPTPPPAPKPTPVVAKSPKKTHWKRGYTVQKGDTLWKIGHLFNVDVNELKSYNNIRNEDLTPGTMIIVP